MLNKKVLIVAAHPKETKGLKDKPLGPHVKICTSGLGKEAKDSLVNILREEMTPPSFILNIGFAGALCPEAKLGDLVLSGEYLKLSDAISNRLKIDRAFIEEIKNHLDKSHPCLEGAILTVDEPLTDAVSRDSLYKTTGAIAVDMESYYLAESVLEDEKVARGSTHFLSLKIISDLADENSERSVKKHGGLLSRELANHTQELLKAL